MKEVISIACSESTNDREKSLGELVSERSTAYLPVSMRIFGFFQVLSLF